MARPQKDNADYFSHDAGMRNDPKMKALRKKFPVVGYAVYNMLLEMLTDTELFQIELTAIGLELMAGDFDTDSETLAAIIDYAVKVQLLCREECVIYSAGLKKRLQPVLDKRKVAKEKYLKQKQENTAVSVTETTQSKVKESKVKNTTTAEVPLPPVEAPPVETEQEARDHNPLLRPLSELAAAASRDEYFLSEALSRAGTANAIPPQKLPELKARLPNLMAAYLQHLRSEETHHMLAKDFRSRFKNWLPKRLKGEQAGTTPPTNQTTDEYLSERQKLKERNRQKYS